MKNGNKNLIVITGPTASGKSALSIELARKLDCDIISADSRQIYKGIPIVTAVPTEEEKKGIKHHLIEILDLQDYYSASQFEEDSLKIIEKLFKNSDYAIVCGGSMLYIDALCEGLDDLPTVSNELRNSLTRDWKNYGDSWLLQKLQELDPVYYENVDQKNLKRVFHGVEISLMSGKPYSSLLKGEKKKREFNIHKFIVDGHRDALFNKINDRVEKMIRAGLEDEARNVYHLRELNSLNTVGLKEMFSFFEGKMNREEAISRIQKNTRVYAKKQMTWFKKDRLSHRVDFQNPIAGNVEMILQVVRNHNLG